MLGNRQTESRGEESTETADKRSEGNISTMQKSPSALKSMRIVLQEVKTATQNKKRWEQVKASASLLSLH